MSDPTRHVRPAPLLAPVFAALALLTARPASAAYQCGQPPTSTQSVANTYRIAWPVTNGVVFHAPMTLEDTDYGVVSGQMGVPDEITDPTQRAQWHQDVWGLEDGTSLFLFFPSQGTSWTIHASVTVVGGGFNQIIMSGPSLADVNQINYGTFTAATSVGAYQGRVVQGSTLPCIVSNAAVPPMTGQWTVLWETPQGGWWHSTMTLTSDSTTGNSMVKGSMACPQELSAAGQCGDWRWDVFGWIGSGVTLTLFGDNYNYPEFPRWIYAPVTGFTQNGVKHAEIDQLGGNDDYSGWNWAPMNLEFQATR